ncbi:C1 family peptidase [Treponema sp.]|uniref:C1 family peptidase n=1 Tax=Treponema sp. TaxID=166 RepID=UPI00298E4522|nr:C1 family peptidase [Treponema sp.]MCR5613728.1 C1 family peptidase [Treponema sp.]
MKKNRGSVSAVLAAAFTVGLVLFASCAPSGGVRGAGGNNGASGKNQKYATGLIEDKESYDKIPVKATLVTREYENLPEAVTLIQYTPVPQSQGQYGTCAAWATTYAAMTTAESVMSGRNNQNESSRKAFSPYYLFRYCKPDDYKGEGMNIFVAVDTLSSHGVPRRASNEKNIQFDKFDISMYDDAQLYKIGSYARLFDYYDGGEWRIQKIKKSLSQKKPVVIGFFDYGVSSFQWSDYKTDWYATSPSEGGGHAMVIVGYDDNHQNPADRGYGAFLFMNSWGTDWGTGGYIWVNYTDAAKYIKQAVELSPSVLAIYNPPVPEPEPEPTPEPEPEPQPAPEPRPEPKPEPQPEPKPQPEPQPKPEPKPQPAPEPRPEPKPEPRPEPQPEPAPNPVPVPKVQIFKGNFSLPLYNKDRDMNVVYKNGCYETTESYAFPTRFQLFMTNKKPCYVYAFASDNTSLKANRIFPPQNTSALLDYTENTVAYPSENESMQLDDVKGTDYLVVLYSLEELDLNAVMKAFEKEAKNYADSDFAIYDIVVNAIGSDKVVSKDSVSFSKNRIDFSCTTQVPESNRVLPVVIKIKHR